MQCHHSESLVALKADFIKKKKSCEQQAEDTVHALTISANKVSECSCEFSQYNCTVTSP